MSNLAITCIHQTNKQVCNDKISVFKTFRYVCVCTLDSSLCVALTMGIHTSVHTLEGPDQGRAIMGTELQCTQAENQINKKTHNSLRIYKQTHSSAFTQRPEECVKTVSTDVHKAWFTKEIHKHPQTGTWETKQTPHCYCTLSVPSDGWHVYLC